MKTLKVAVVIMVLMLCIRVSPVQAQCAMCKATVESNVNAEKTVGRGLNDGILYLMTIPYLVLGGFAWMVYKNWKGGRND